MRTLFKRIITYVLALLLVISILPSFTVHAYAGDNRTVRVGFFAYPGYHELNNGVRSGYGYDFLMLLQRYTDLNFEFVGYECSWEEMLKMLDAGEIDLVTSARKTADREKLFDFSEPIGTNNAQINVRLDDSRFVPGYYAALDGMLIGEISGNSRNADLVLFAAEKGFSYDVREYATAEELEQALQNKEIDAAVTSSLRKTHGEKTVAEFAPQEFYAVVKKGNSELLEEINYGINEMDVNEGNWREDLHYVNYNLLSETGLDFTQREKEYIQAVKSGEKKITVAAQPDRGPYSFVENGKLTGIIPDYFAHLMDMAGLPYAGLIPEDRDEYRTWLQENRTDAVMDCLYGSAPSADSDFGLLTDSYLQLTTSRVTQKGFSGTIGSIAVVDAVGPNYSDEDVAENAEYVVVKSAEDCLRAVSEGKADACYVYTFTADKFINSDPTSNLQATILNDPVYSMRIYVSPNADHELCSILNKCIKADSSGSLNKYIKDYTTVSYTNLSLDQYMKLHPGYVITGSAVFLVLIALIAVMMVRTRTQKLMEKQLDSELEHQKQLQEALNLAELEQHRTDVLHDIIHSGKWIFFVNKDDEIVGSDVSEAANSIINNDIAPDGYAWLDIVHPDDRKMAAAAFRATIEDHSCGTPYDINYRMIDRNGEYHWFHSAGRIIRDADGDGRFFGIHVDITDQMEEQQKRLLGAIPLSPDILTKANIGLWSFELDEGQPPRMYGDDAMIKLVGLDHQVSPEEMYHAWYDHIDDGSYDIVTDAVAKMSSGEHAEVQYPWHHPDGHTMIVRCGGIRNFEYTKGIRIEGTHQDVTETLHFDEEQQKQKEKVILEPFIANYNLVYRVNLSDASFELLKIENGIVGADNVFNDFTEARDFFINNIAYVSDREKIKAVMDFDAIRERLKTQSTFSEEYRAVLEGVSVWHEMTISALGENEVVIGYAIKDSEVLNRHISKAILDNYDAIYVANLNTDQMKVLKASGLMLNKPQVVTYSKMIREFASGLGEEAKEYFENAADIEAEKVLLRKDSKAEYAYLSPYYEEGPVWVKSEIHVLTWADGDPETVVIGITRIDSLQREKIELNEQLQTALEAAQTANNAKTDFLFNMSHDIRTPMNAILGYTDIALNHVNEPEKISDSLKKIKTSGGHLLSLINDILEMSRIEAGRMEIVKAPVNAFDVTESITNMSLALAATRDINFRTEISELKDPYIYADELHTNQIVINLISNAIKYTNPGGTVVYSIDQLSEPKDGIANYRLTVKDNGIGMSEEFQKHLFESFSREHTATVSKQEGAGLGLAIVKKIVDLMGGTISVQSRQGEGSTFVVELPLEVMDAAAIEKYKDEHGSLTEKMDDLKLDGKRILLVEDNEMNREIATEILEENGLTVETAEDGAIAVDMVSEKGTDHYDLILMDIQMPVMNGYEATAAIRNLPGGSSIPIIALSANAFKEDMEKSVSAGMNAHVAKPIDVRTLTDTMRSLMK